MTTTRRAKATRREIPAHWRTLMERKALPSIRRLAEAADLDHVTVTRVIFGDKPASERVVQALAGALEVDMKTAYRLMGNPVGHVEPWTPPAASARLDKEQRRVLEDLIYVMVEGHRPGMGTRPAPAPEGAHPEEGGYSLAADRSHGLSEWQKWEDEDEPQS
jgi:hypothetical protein